MSIRNFASEVFGTNATEGLLTATPRQRFNFTLEMVIDNQTITFERVQDVTLPGYSFDTQIVNQYNKKRVVQTKLNYGQLTVNFYDTFDSKFHNVLRKYIANYYNTGNGIDPFLDPTEQTEGVLGDLFDTNMGFTPGFGKRYFLPSIKIIQKGVNGHRRATTLKNCLMLNANGDTLSYSDSNPVLWNVTFQPESISVTDIPDRDPSVSP